MSPEKFRPNPLSVVLALSAVFFVIFLILSGAFFLNRSPSGADRSGATSGIFGGAFRTLSEAVGVVELNGVILDSKKILRKLERMEENEQIRAVVLRLNSPGGSVAPSQEIYEAVKRYKKPLVVSMGSVAASGAYYIACGAKKVFANPGTMTGSIGVIMEFANLEKLYDWAKVHRYSIKTGQFKDVGAEYRSMSESERNLLQSMVNNILEQFKHAVATGRKISPAQVTAVADGRIFTGNQAKELNLVDELGTLQDAIREAGEQAGIKGKPRVVYADRQKRGLLDLLMDDSMSDSSGSGGESKASDLGLAVGRILNAVEILGRMAKGITDGVGTGMGVPSSAFSGASSSGGVPGVYWIWSGAGVQEH